MQQRFGFDPEKDGRLAAAERLGGRDGLWGRVWERYAEAPQLYTRIPELLRSARPQHPGELFFLRDSWPQDNEAEEADLRGRLSALHGQAQAEAARTIRSLEKAHGERRGWVWSRLGQAPLAGALHHLTRLADAVTAPLPGYDRESLAASYREAGWQADDAALASLAAVDQPADIAAVRAAVRALYLPWLQHTAARLQQRVAAEPFASHTARDPLPFQEGTCYLFVDGLRYDVGRRLAEAMRKCGWEVAEDWRWSALPTVTATAKPAVSPASGLIAGEPGDAGFNPRVAASGQDLTTDRFRKLLGQQSVAYFGRSETGDPSGCGWTEIGDLDRTGHEEGARLAHRIDERVRDVVARIGSLLEAGWARVHIITDHGWLLMPGGLPKIELPAYLVASRWGRCAVLKETSQSTMPTVGWYWNAAVRVVTAPEVGVFYEGPEYAHGGVSLQETIIPEVVVSASSRPRTAARIVSVEWVHMRCRVQVEGDLPGCSVDLRTRAADPQTSVASARAVGAEGQVSLLVGDDSHEGCAVTAVLLDAAGTVIAREHTKVGG
jgi:hypothetical protein